MGISVPAGRPSRPSDGPAAWVHPPAALTFVAEAGVHCQIFRDTAGGYLVGHQTVLGDRGARELRRVATLPCAYSLCHELEEQHARPQGLLRR